MSRVWAYYFAARGSYSTLRGRIEFQLYARSGSYRRWYEAAVAR